MCQQFGSKNKIEAISQAAGRAQKPNGMRHLRVTVPLKVKEQTVEVVSPEPRNQHCPVHTAVVVETKPLPELLPITEREEDKCLGFFHQSIPLPEPNGKPFAREAWEMWFVESTPEQQAEEQGEGRTGLEGKQAKTGGKPSRGVFSFICSPSFWL